MEIFLLSLLGFYAYLSHLLIAALSFSSQRDRIQYRVHVNGIRGKSTVTRYVSAIFRAAGYKTFGKTTGTAARVLLPNGQDFDFGRKGYPNINEQVKILKGFSAQGAEAVVMECMAVNPLYAEWLESKVMRSHISIITNVRIDHTDYMGETLEEIAESLSKTIPQNGIVITAETKPELLTILYKNASRLNSRLVVANRDDVGVTELQGFSHFAIEDNIAIGLELAKLLKVPRDTAIAAMQSAASDPGAFSIQFVEFDKHQIAWANLLAVNDKESFIDLCQRLFKQFEGYAKVVILNNRSDRPTRVELFAVIARELGFDRVITFGDYESTVNKQFTHTPARPESGRREQISNLGNSSRFKDASAKELITQGLAGLANRKVLLIGTVNIHSPQAERLLEFFEHQAQNLDAIATTINTQKPQLEMVSGYIRQELRG